MKTTKVIFLLLLVFIFLQNHVAGQSSPPAAQDELNVHFNNLRHRLDVLQKKIDDVLWFERVGDIAYVDKVFLAGEPPRGFEHAKTLQEANPIKFWSYVFIPKDIDPSRKYPLIVLPHGGVHGDFNTYYTHIIRELIAQQYIVVAPEYRGSTGYGRLTYELIDYGGLENADVDISRQYMVDNYSIVDRSRVGIVGWSHGGMIALMNIFENPRNYKCAFAGVPVSDLIARMGYKRPAYEDYYSADYHIGDMVHENIDEYRRRSPVYHAHKLQTPLLIHTNTNDEDVHVLEVENLINALKAQGKSFEYEIFQDIPGGHSFDRMDHKQGREIRFKIYKFLEKHLDPPAKFRNLSEMEQAAYRFR
ncbi:MAG: alpha/beta fold hydrolase [Bacteroidales bacterium]|nr:alpha/beta fold hydrolase [Bacteroidales bacterium]